MKPVISFLIALLFVSCAQGKERAYTASTPAGYEVKIFLGIPLADSVDFIRWRLTIDGNHYSLHCNYGISKANTNGFISGGNTIEIKGEVEKQDHNFQLKNGNKILKYAVLNTDLLQLLDEKNAYLNGNGGWSYTLNSLNPMITSIAGNKTEPLVIKDSVVFTGRTPCAIPGITPAGTECYKMKWKMVLYAANGNKPAAYKIYGTRWRTENGLTGTWKTYTGTSGNTIYQLAYNNGKDFIYLLKPGENILLFTDANEKCLVGDADFSYTLNRD